jgi:tRNA (cmo5U34)-methyltransferase
VSTADASVSAHLGIDLAEYDARIRTFIPDYEEMLRIAAAVVATIRPRTIVDLGTGTGALAAQVVRRASHVRIVGIDEDAGMLAMARRRLRNRGALIHDSFLRAALPPCDAVIASFSLHHVASPRVKRALYHSARKALRPSGMFVSADCYPSSLASFARDGRRDWRAHVARTYGARKAAAFLRSWAREDFYLPLDIELQLLQSAGFVVDVAWRRNPFAVIVGQRASQA